MLPQTWDWEKIVRKTEEALIGASKILSPLYPLLLSPTSKLIILSKLNVHIHILCLKTMIYLMDDDHLNRIRKECDKQTNHQHLILFNLQDCWNDDYHSSAGKKLNKNKNKSSGTIDCRHSWTGQRCNPCVERVNPRSGDTSITQGENSAQEKSSNCIWTGLHKCIGGISQFRSPCPCLDAMVISVHHCGIN